MIQVTTNQPFPKPSELGYTREMPRYIAFYWEPMGDELASYDGRNTTVGMLDNWKFLNWKQAAIMEGHILETGDSENEAMYWLIYDNEDQKLYTLPAHEASSLVEHQWPERAEFPYGEFPNYKEITDPHFYDDLGEFPDKLVIDGEEREFEHIDLTQYRDDPEDTLKLDGIALEFKQVFFDDPTPTIKFQAIKGLNTLPYCTCLVPMIRSGDNICHNPGCGKPLSF